MRLCVLGPSYQHSTSELRDHDPRCDPSVYLPEHSFEECLIDKATAVRHVGRLARRGFDVFVNLCDGAWDEDRPGIEVVHALERLGLAFTGAGSSFYEPTRAAMKMACHYAGIATPAFAFARDRMEAERAAATLRYPIIVKHPNGYNSVGLTRDSRVTTPTQLLERADAAIEAYGGCLLEEFIEGREFTALVAEPGEGESVPRAYPPIEFTFPPGESFKHFDLKWIDHATMQSVPVTDPALSEAILQRSRDLFLSLGGTGYGRCDLRMNAEGELFMLEINPNCSVFYPTGSFGSADAILALDRGGHRGFLEHLIACARRRQRRALPAYEVHFDPSAGYGLRAARDLTIGEVVDRHEERAHHLVSRAHVERSWDEKHRRWYRQYAWPLTDDVAVMWSDRIEDWRPLNHSCDPNTWLSGLDLVARTAIRKGQAITIDYATFCGPAMEDFPCSCASVLCRGVVRGSDHLQAFVGERYGDHVSDYVRRARRAREGAKD